MGSDLAVTLTVEQLERIVRKVVREETAERIGVNDLELLTREAIATAFKVSTKHVLVMVSRDGLPAVRFGSEWRFPKANVIAWIKDRAVMPGVHSGKYARALKTIEAA